ncbi:MAG: nuclear transport factor 2 family protein [Acidobacteria bacterium]|nr:nuclear transport factor 2 family protein [Acidobacteriota bacterium]
MKEKEEREVLDVARRLLRAYAEKDLEAFRETFDEDASGFWTKPYRADGREEILASMAESFKSIEVSHWSLRQPRVQIHGDVAVVSFHWSESGRFGDQHYDITGKATEVYVKTKKGWKTIHYHYSVNPGVESHV